MPTPAHRLLQLACVLCLARPLRTASPLLAYECNVDPKACAAGFLDIRAACGYAAGAQALFGQARAGACPAWLQRQIDETCSACLRPACDLHDRPAEQRFFPTGAQQRFTAADTTEWRRPTETCGGRALRCDLSKCAANWAVTRRFLSSACLGTPFQVQIQPSRHDVFNLTDAQPCQPKWCKPVYSAVSEVPVYFEERQCVHDSALAATGDFPVPPPPFPVLTGQVSSLPSY